MNNITIVGRLISQPELRFTPNGVPTCRATLSVSRNNGKKDDRGYPESDLFTVEVWRKQAESLSQHATKGSIIGVVGRMESNKHDEKTFWALKAENWNFVGSKQGGQEGGFNGDVPF
jgi:single-strand DNA-binding protein